MARKKEAAKSISADDLSGFKYFSLLAGLLERLHAQGAERDKAGNRRLFYDQYALLLLLYYFNPVVTTLRGVSQFTTLEKVQRRLGVRSTSLGSLSEASRVFDPAALEPIIQELAQRVGSRPEALPPAEQAALKGLVAVDGSLLEALPQMAWALWQDPTHRAVKMHVAFAVWAHAPVQVTVTPGNGPERPQLRRLVEPGGFYVMDRGYADYSLFHELDQAGCYFVARVQENAVWEAERENPLSPRDVAQRVIRDVTLKRLGTAKHNALLERPLRLVETRGEAAGERWVLVTNRHDLSAELVVTAYRHRWQVELYFRWLKCVLGCRHLLSQSQSGVQLQIYLAIIASLLIALWVGGKPNKRTYEMLCHYLNGWATDAEVENHLLKLRQATGPPSNS